MDVDKSFEQQQPATAFHAPGGQTVPAPTKIPLGGPYDELATRTAPHCATASIMPSNERVPPAAVPLLPQFEHYAARCRTLPAL